MKRIKLGIGIFALANLAFLNFAKSEHIQRVSNNSKDSIKITVTTSISISVTSGSSSSTASGGDELRWSPLTPCEPDRDKFYSSCIKHNGTSNTCSTAGETTCICNENC